MNDNELDDLVRRLHRLTVAPKFPEYEHPTDRMRREQIVECRDAITALRAEVAALRAVVAAADAMRDRYLACSHSIDCDTPWSVTQYDAARAALKEKT